MGSKNWKVVALCFAGATIFWFFNSLGKEYTTRIDYPIRFSYSLEGTTIVGSLPKSVELNVTAGGWVLLQHSLNPNRMAPVIIFLENPTQTQYLTRNQLRTVISESLKDLTLNYVLTDTLRFLIEEEGSRTLSLRADLEALTFDEGYQRSSPLSLQPDTIKITGPISQINELSDSLTLTLTGEDIDERFEQTVEVSTLLPYPELIPDPRQIEASFEVSEYDLQEFKVPITTQGFPADSSYYLADSTVSVLLWLPIQPEGAYDTLEITAILYADSIQEVDSIAKPYVTVNNLTPGTTQMVPQWVRILRPEKE